MTKEEAEKTLLGVIDKLKLTKEEREYLYKALEVFKGDSK